MTREAFGELGAGHAEAGRIGSADDDSRRQMARAWLVAHGIDTMMVSVPKIARALGYAPATLYGYIKGGTFFLPYRLVNGSPLVALDDLLAWVCDKSLDARSESMADFLEEDEERCGARRGSKSRDSDEPESESLEIDQIRRRMMERAAAKVDRLTTQQAVISRVSTASSVH